ncbi:DUF4148 domain-containing protein [Paraburkholderia sp. MMS20-SJTN17]|uniref:DUF4148 domain-containing protein n=1 Tax=Paraburkholderia translucens TaxID=2886945 RepID=A0ABS8K7B1_9BURK|nr:DUF4148 domain-containing protein [Paraburkholderia sp. MMS20-SJTN17]MCC8400631.1 DUF4148 domain-containing protein [Paraburkholderia sp. MMS20-SJTN17]
MKSESVSQYSSLSLCKIAIAGVMAMASSASLYAQTVSRPEPHQVTRAEVVHELEELEAAGYNPSQGDDGSYPADIQAAEAKVAAMHRAERSAAANAGQSGPQMQMH